MIRGAGRDGARRKQPSATMPNRNPAAGAFARAFSDRFGVQRIAVGAGRTPEPRRSYPLGVFMALAIAAVASLSYWDAQREAALALQDFAAEQTTLAETAAVAISARVPIHDTPTERADTRELLAAVLAIEEPESRRVLLERPGERGLAATNGAIIRSESVERALDRGDRSVRLSREEAGAFGLPKRTAIAGLASIDGAQGRLGIAVVTTALRERDRETRTERRLVFGVLVAACLVLSFGGLSLRKQRKELELERRIAVADLERERDQRLLQIDKLATVGALATGIAHEVSTPLGVILGRADQLLPKVAGDETARRAVLSILDQGHHINGVIRGFLHLARGESSPFERVDPGVLVREAAALVEHRFAKAGVRLEASAADDLPAIACEPKLFEQVLINLLLNACDACESGGTVVLSVASRGGRVVFEVADDGEGITEEAAARAVEPFFTTKPAGKGTGLGLAIANEIVHHHGGELRLTPRASGSSGTTASVDLPTAAGDA